MPTSDVDRHVLPRRAGHGPADEDSDGMTPVARPTFSDSLATAAGRQHLQMWQAAQTVRAHVAAGEHRDDVLACLGLSDVVAPAGPTPTAPRC